MTWVKTAEDRARDKAVYGDPEYQANRKLALQRAGRACENLINGRRCGSRSRVQVDHIKAVTQGGTHHLDNLRVLCKPCHDKKTAGEGGGYRKPGRTRTPQADPPLVTRTTW